MAQEVLTEADLRSRIAKALKLPDIPDEAWREVRDDGLVYNALDGGVDERQDLLRVLKQRKRSAKSFMASGKIPPGRKADVYAEPFYRPEERLRRDALTLHLWREARADAEVRAFRRDVLGDRLLSEEEAVRFIRLPSVALFSVTDFAAWGLPVVGHTAELTHMSDDGKRTVAITYASMSLSKARTLSGIPDFLPYQHPAIDHVARVPFWEGSVLAHLHDLGERLAEENRWAEDVATMFVLMDIMPMVHPATTTIRTSPRPVANTIALTLSPWLDAKTVEAVYRAAQRELLGGDNDGPQVRALTLFRFIEERTNVDGKRPPWRTIMEEWNGRYPDWLYDNERNFQRRYREVHDNLIYGKRKRTSANMDAG